MMSYSGPSPKQIAEQNAQREQMKAKAISMATDIMQGYEAASLAVRQQEGTPLASEGSEATANPTPDAE